MEIVRHDPSHYVKAEVRPCVAHVGRIIHRRAARVPSDVAILHGDEGLLFTR